MYNSVYHLKETTRHPFESHTKCNGRSSVNWTKYEERNFMKGMIFNANIGKEIDIPGRPCKRCQNLALK